MALSGWVMEASRTYFGNAASRRDFRVQMRGPKPFWMFTLYVLSLALIGMGFYWSILGRVGLSLSSAQSELTSFFNALIYLLAGAICVISPALTGTAIVAERQRQSLDLVLSAPVEPKYLLVGKMISSYRYTWMLLILSLPIVAMSVVLGGATWKDVFSCFLLLSFHAMIFTSLALLISSLTSRPASAVIWSFFAVAAYVAASSILSGSAMSRSFMGGPSAHLPFTIALSPFFILQAINSSTQIYSWEVPNWVIAAVVSLLLSRLFLLGAAVNLAPLDKRLSANLRITGLVYSFLLGALVTYSMFSTMMFSRGGMGNQGPTPQELGLLVLNIGLASVGWLALAIPMLSCYGWEGSRRFWPNGQFSIRHLLDGTPAGYLPYALLLVASGIFGSYCGNIWSGEPGASSALLKGFVWAAGFITMTWGLGRVLSAGCRTMKTARALQLAALATVYFGLPIVMSVFRLAPAWINDPEIPTTQLWYLFPFTPLFSVELFNFAVTYGLIMLGIGVGFMLWGMRLEGKRSRRTAFDQ